MNKQTPWIYHVIFAGRLDHWGTTAFNWPVKTISGDRPKFFSGQLYVRYIKGAGFQYKYEDETHDDKELKADMQLW